MATIPGIPAAVVATIEAVFPGIVTPGRQAQALAWYTQAIVEISATYWRQNYNSAIGLVVAHYLLKFPVNGAMADRSVVESESSQSNGSTTFAKIDIRAPDAFWLETTAGRAYLNLRERLLPRGPYVI